MLTGSDTVSGIRYYAQDDFGNVQGQFSDYAHTTQTVKYGDWGLPTVTGETTNRLTWKGLSYDPDVGLTYMRARWYDPNIGRFVSEDPLGLGGGINPYIYANNDPINGFDPSGMTAMQSDDDCTVMYMWWGKDRGWQHAIPGTLWIFCGRGSGSDGAAPVDGVLVVHGGGGRRSGSNADKARICKENPVNKTGALDLQANMQTASILANQFWAGVTSGNAAQTAGAVTTYIKLIRTGGAWDPKNWPGERSPSAQSTNVAAGNINFGATCGQFGGNTWLGGEACQYGAGIYGKWTGNYGSSLLSPYHGDWPADNVQIQQGLAIAKGGC
jgi:RHS repeat-associated protein